MPTGEPASAEARGAADAHDTHVSSPDEGASLTNALEALERLRPVIEQVPLEKLRTINASGPTAVEASAMVAQLLLAHRLDLAEVFVNPPQTPDLADRALAFWAATSRYETIHQRSKEKAALRALRHEGKEARKLAIAVLTAFAHRDAPTREVLEEVRKGKGRRDLASDLNKLYLALLRHRAPVIQAGLLSEAQLEEVGVIGPALLAYTDRSAVDDAKVLRQQAFTHLAGAFLRAVRCLRFLYEERPELAHPLPTLSHGVPT